MKPTTLIVTGLAAAAVAAPLSQAATSDKAQIAGRLVAPSQISEAQLNAGHNPATRTAQIGGALVAPAQMSAWEQNAGSASSTGAGDSSSGIGTGGITAAAVLGALALLAAVSTMILRRRRGLVTA